VGRLYKQVKSRRLLEKSFRKVREHAVASPSRSTRAALAEFEKDLFLSIDKLQKRLGKQDFQFNPQRGIAKRKPNSAAYRPLVVAPLDDRIIQRAILEVLITAVPAVREVMSTPTSIGGIPGRGVKSALNLVANAIARGASYYARSDIESFFTKIPKRLVKDFLRDHVKDQEFLGLFDGALETELENLNELAEHRSLFPIGDDGVPQGSALSTLAGNIVLTEFDRVLNGRNILCVRYVDDYIILGPDESRVRKAFESSQELLRKLHMRAYSPWADEEKAGHGRVARGFSFLGCDIKPDIKLVQPGRKARVKIIHDIQAVFSETLRALTEALTAGYPVDRKQCYAQVMVRVNGIVSGWAHAFRFCNCISTFESLDHEIDKAVSRFNREFRRLFEPESLRAIRRFLGVQLLQDVSSGAFIADWPPR
jgi:RNA-directed DNA polymerase